MVCAVGCRSTSEEHTERRLSEQPRMDSARVVAFHCQLAEKRVAAQDQPDAAA